MTSNGRLHLPSLWQLLGSGLALVVLVISAVGLFVAGLTTISAGGVSDAEVYPFFSLAWICILIGALQLPPVVLAILRLAGRRPPAWKLPGGLTVSSALMLLWPLLLLAGTSLSDTSLPVWVFTPPIQVLAVALPLWWFVELGRRGLSAGGAQRSWGITSFSLIVSPPLILMAEFILLGVLGVVALLWLASQPLLVEQLNRLAQRLVNAQMDPEVTLRIIRPWLRSPLLIFTTFSVGAGLIPVLEETLKPLALWGWTRRLTPSQGFVAGLLCGSMFALLESLGTFVSPLGGEWVGVVLGRTGTSLLHTVTTALVGWGLATAWSREDYPGLGLVFFLGIALHGIWNLFSLAIMFQPMLGDNLAAFPLVDRLGQIAPFALMVLVVVFFLLLVGGNRRLRLEKGRQESLAPAAPQEAVQAEPPLV